MTNDYRRLDEEAIESQAQILAGSEEHFLCAQAKIFTMIGGGMLGSMAVEQPGIFYIDDRVGRLPYSRRAIYQAVKVYKRAYALRAEAGEPIPAMKMLNLGVY